MRRPPPAKIGASLDEGGKARVVVGQSGYDMIKLAVVPSDHVGDYGMHPTVGERAVEGFSAW